MGGAASAPTTAPVALAPGGFTTAQGGVTLQFPAAGASGAEYLIVAQLATAVPDLCSDYSLATPPAAVREAGGAGRSVAQQFHDMLRRREAELARHTFTAPPGQRALLLQPPPSLGSKRTFRVCSDIGCSSLTNVVATVQYVGSHLAVYIDDAAPAGGFAGSDLTNLGAMFDNVLYPIDTDRFGAESDIDGNGVVLILLSKQINALVPKPDCNTSFITGFFFGADIDPSVAPQYNNGEIFYGMVPDTGGAVSCPYSKTFVQHVLPVTFIHEFQHMISYHQHVLVRGGLDETLWLNEAMSHLAEELGGLHYDSLGIDTTASRFFVGNLFNAYEYLRDPRATTVITETPPGALDERGAAWLFLRYVVDQAGSGVTRLLEQTALTGAANVEAATGLNYQVLLGRSALAAFLTDYPGFAAPPELTYQHWSFRATFASLHAQDAADFPVAYPLKPDSGQAGGASSSGSVRSGGSAYLILTQPPNAAAFALRLRDGGGGLIATQAGAQVAVARVH